MTQELSLQTIVSATQEELLATELSETEMVMLNMDKGLYYGMEDVAKTIWRALAEPRSVDDLCQVVLAKYSGADREMVEPDILAFLGELLNDELIHVHDDR